MSSGLSVTNRRVFAIAGPAMLANLTTPLIGIVSTAAIGRLGDPHLLGGVALASVAFDCIFWLFGFLRMATVAFTAQALGAGDRIEVRAILLRALMLGAAIGLTLIVLRTPLAALVFNIMGGSDAVTSAARQYFFIRLWSAPLMLGNYVILGWLVGQARTGIALALQVGINLANMALTSLLVLQFDFGVSGAALATVIAETAGFLAGLIAVWKILGGRIDVPRAVLFDRIRLLRLFAVNRDIHIRAAQLANRLPQAGEQAAQRFVVHRVHIGRVHHLHEVEDLAVLAEEQGMQRRVGVALLEARKHVVGQDEAAHFRQQDHHDGAGRLVGLVVVAESAHDRINA